MKKLIKGSIYLFLIFSTLLLFFSCKTNKTDKVHGCTDPLAYNYNIEAEEEDDSCIYDCSQASHFVIKTTNGGLDWKKSCLFNNEGAQNISNIIDISITDENNIWMCSTDPRASILHTSDGGVSWEVQYSGALKTAFFNYIEMFDELNGIAMGDGVTVPLILNTNDGGATWNEVQVSTSPGSSSGDTWRRIDFVNLNVGYFHTGWDLYKTIDGGKNWSVTSYPPQNCMVLKFFNEQIGIVAENALKIHITIDGGTTWESVDLPESTGWGMDIEFSPNDPSRIWFLGIGSVWFSQDTGLTWTKQDSFTTADGNVRDMVISDGEGWILGSNKNKTSYHSTDAINGNWEAINPPVPANFRTGEGIDCVGGDIVVIPGCIWSF